MEELIFVAAIAVIGLVAFFEPCTIATHTLFGVRTNKMETKEKFFEAAKIFLSRTFLYTVLLLIILSIFDKQKWETISPEILFIVLAAVYFISRFSYIPIPHVDFSFLLPPALKKEDSITLGVTLPACTIPLFITVAGITLTVHTTAFTLIASLIYSAMFTLPTIITIFKGASVKTRKIFGITAKTAPFITSGLYIAAASFLFFSKLNLSTENIRALISEPSLMGIAIGFIAGFIFSFNPVSFSAIPVMLAYVTKAEKKNQAMAMGVFFVAGMIFIQVALGLAAALGGEWAQTVMGRFWGVVLGPILIILGFIWPGWLKLNIPWFGIKGKKAVTYWGAFLLGVPFAIAICPFCSPALVVMLTASAAIGSPAFGFFLLFAFALGRGVPIMIGAYSVGWLESMNKFSKYQKMFEIFAGVVLIFSGLYLLNEYFFIVGY